MEATAQPLVYNTPTLPPEWVEYRTPTGQPYWYNTMTRQSSWVFPMFASKMVQPILAPPKKKQTKKKIPGTNWLFVITFDGYEFFYDRDTKESVWEMPDELKEPMEQLKKQEEEEKENKKRALQEEQENEAKRIKLEIEREREERQNQEQEKQVKEEPNEYTEMTEDDFMWQLQQMEQEDHQEEQMIENEEQEQEQDPLIEKQGQVVEQQEPPIEENTTKEVEYSHVQYEEQQKILEEQYRQHRLMEEQYRQEQQEKNKILEQEFFDLLRERNISPFSVYSAEYPKLMSDPRFINVANNKQKALFNKYCNELSEKIKNERKNKKKPEDEFRELLGLVTEKMYWDDFRRKFKNDSRFKAIQNTREKELMFKNHVKNLGKNPVDNYIKLLKDTKEICKGIRWRDAKKLLENDDRYHAIEPKTKREDLFRDYLDGLIL